MNSERIIQAKLSAAVKKLRRQCHGPAGRRIRRRSPEHSLITRYGGGFLVVTFMTVLSYPFIAAGKSGNMGQCWAGLAFFMLHLTAYFYHRLRWSLFQDGDLRALAALPAGPRWLARRQIKRALGGAWWPISLTCLMFFIIGLMLGLDGWGWAASPLVAPVFLSFSLALGFLIVIWPLAQQALRWVLMVGWLLSFAAVQVESVRDHVLAALSNSGHLLSILLPTGWMARSWWGLCVDGYAPQIWFLLPVAALILLAWFCRARFALMLERSLEAQLAFALAEPPDWFSEEDRDEFAASLNPPKSAGRSEIEEAIEQREFLQRTLDGEPTIFDSWFWTRLSERSKAIAHYFWSGFWLGLGRGWLRAALWLAAIWLGCWLIKTHFPQARVWLCAIGFFIAVGAGGGYGQSAFTSAGVHLVPVGAWEVLWHRCRLMVLSLTLSAPLLLAHALLIRLILNVPLVDAFSWWLHGMMALAALGIWWSSEMGGVAIRGWRFLSWLVKYGTLAGMVAATFQAILQGGASAWVASLACLGLALAKSCSFCWLHDSVRTDL